MWFLPLAYYDEFIKKLDYRLKKKTKKSQTEIFCDNNVKMMAEKFKQNIRHKKVFCKLFNIHYNTRCPICASTNITQTGDHSSSGCNSYVCNDCGCQFGN